MYYPCSENKGADQLYEADLRLCFTYADCWFSHEAAQKLNDTGVQMYSYSLDHVYF